MRSPRYRMNVIAKPSLAFTNGSGGVCRLLIKRELLETIIWFDKEVAFMEDRLSQLKLSLRVSASPLMTVGYYHYRVHESSVVNLYKSFHERQVHAFRKLQSLLEREGKTDELAQGLKCAISSSSPCWPQRMRRTKAILSRWAARNSRISLPS